MDEVLKDNPLMKFFRQFCQQQHFGGKPSINYGSLLDQELIIWLVFFRAWSRECVWKLMEMDNTGITAEEAVNSRAAIYKMLIPGKPEELCALLLLRYQLTGNLDLIPIAFMTWLNAQLAYVINEIETRAKPKKIGNMLLGMIFDHNDYPKKELLEAVRREAKKWRPGADVFKSYHRDEDRDDRIQEVLTACLAFQKQLTGTPKFVPYGELYIPQLPLIANLPRQRSNALVRVNELLALNDVVALWRDVLPCLQGGTERLPEKAYQSIRTRDDRRKTQKRTGKTVDLKDDQIFSEPLPSLGMLYRRVQSHWGKRGVAFLESLTKGDTVIEASKKAGVSRQTGQKYLREIKKDLK